MVLVLKQVSNYHNSQRTRKRLDILDPNRFSFWVFSEKRGIGVNETAPHNREVFCELTM